LKNTLVNILKIGIPLILALYICWYIWSSFTAEDKSEFGKVFLNANYLYIGLALLVGLASHLSRAHRWRYMLRTMGYDPGLKASFHATMIGNIVNIILPRVGEMSRAGVLRATHEIPFDKGFGTIVAERVIDMVCLAIVAGMALLFNYNHISDLIQIGNNINTTQEGGAGGSYTKYILLGIFLVGAIALFVVLKIKPQLKDKIIQFIKGLWEGLVTIFRMKDRWSYIGHTVIIWSCYVIMFWIPFYALDFTRDLPIEGVMAAFVSGTIGFIIVQGGLGLYPVMVGAVITFFRNPNYFEETGNIVMPEDSGFGFLIWLTQTAVVVIFGLYSLLSVKRTKKAKLTQRQ
jgi:glycosyltransferase 2 family protein